MSLSLLRSHPLLGAGVALAAGLAIGAAAAAAGTSVQSPDPAKPPVERAPGAPPPAQTQTQTQTPANPPPATQTQTQVQKPDTTSTSTQTGTPPAPPRWDDTVVRLMTAAAALIKEFSLAFVALLLVLVFFRPFKALLAKVTDSIGSSAVTLDVGAAFKLTVAEPTVTAADDRRPLWSASPFEVEDDAPGDAKALLREIAPQLTLPASDYVAHYRLVRVDDPKVAAMRAARRTLQDAAANRKRDFASLRGELDAFVAALDAALYLEADQFARILGDRPVLRLGIEALDPLQKQVKDFMALHAAGIAYTLEGEWPAAARLLDRIAWVDPDPLYAPAVSAWLAAQYHAYLEELENRHPQVELDSTEFFGKVQELMDKARRLLAALRQAPWDQARPSPRGFFVREALKDLGSIGSILAEYADPGPAQDRRLEQAEIDLVESAAPIEGDPDSPLDHNNLADLYRQRGDAARRNGKQEAVYDEYYAKAHAELDRACAADPSDPTFCHTRALVYYSERRHELALRALEQCTEGRAAAAAAGDIEQYVVNQTLAAKLLMTATPDDAPPDLARITWVLERAREFTLTHRLTLGDKTVDLLANLQELLGAAYLQWRDRESAAVEAFDRLLRLKHWRPMDVVKVRVHLLHGRALIRLARARRRDYSREEASDLRERARVGLIALVALLDTFKVDSSVPDRRRERNTRFRLDVLVSLQSLAEEYFAGEEFARARGVLEKETELAASLDKSSLSDQAMRDEIDRTARRRAFLGGRIRIRLEPHTPELISAIEETFNRARGLGAEQDCQIDLELGDLLLRSARQGQGTPLLLYERAVDAFERAAGRTAPALRGDTIRALSAAYAMRDTIVRKAKATAGTSSGAAK